MMPALFISALCNTLSGSPTVVLVLAQEGAPSRLQQVADAFGRSDSSSFMSNLPAGALVFAVGLAALLAVTWWVYRLALADARRYGSQCRRLARGLGLSLGQLLLINGIARRQGLLNASGLLISRGTFDHHTARFLTASSSKARSGSNAARRIASIRRRLFDADD